MSRRRWMLPPLLLLGLAGMASPGTAAAQGMVRLEFDPAAVAFPAPGVLEFDAGWIDHGALRVSVTSRPLNRPWELRVRASDVAMGQGKPVSDLLWRVAGTGTWQPLGSTDALVLQGQGDQDITLEFRLQLGWVTDPPGTYMAGIAFTIVRL